MYLEDLSPCRVIPVDAEPTGRSIGWLELGYPFETGKTPSRFRSILLQLTKDIKNPMWGFHECAFCGDKGASGSGEIHVVGSDGVTYVAPSMIFHYIDVHEYLPPQQFLDAVLSNDC